MAFNSLFLHKITMTALARSDVDVVLVIGCVVDDSFGKSDAEGVLFA